jgi:hypothetical protein
MSRGVPFAPGNKFGRGRPKGSRNKAGLVWPRLLEEYGEPLLRKCIAMALRENPQAMRLCMERLLPIRGAAPVSFTVPAVATAAEVDEAVTRLLEAVGRGQLTPAEAKEIALILEGKRRALETRELTARIEELETRVPQRDRR